MEVLRVNDDNFRNKLISFCSVNCEGETLYWAGNDSLKDILAWWNSEDFAGPANDDYVLQLIVKGHIIFDYCNEYAHGPISNDIPSFEQMLHMLEAFDTWIEDARNKAIPVKECEPLIRISDIEWDTDGDKDALAELPTSVDLNEFIDEDDVADYLSDEYGYCVRNFDFEDNSWNSAESFTGISEYHKSSVAVAKASVMHNKSYYLDKFKDKIAKCEEEERNTAWQEGVEYDSSFAHERFDEECNAEEIVGYYINYNGDDALKIWRENIEGRVITDEIREVTRILEYLYTSEPYAISPQTALAVLAANMPKDFSGFNSETESGEPEYLMDLPNGRTLKIVYQDTGYSWQVLYSDEEFTELDYNPDDLVIAEEDVDDFDYDTVYMELDWAIRIAAETPKYEPTKPNFTIGDEVRYTKTDVFCYVVKVPDDGGIRLYDTCNDSVIVLRDDELDSLVLEGHSEMAEKVFS